MKRDMELVRQLLMEIDESPDLDGRRWVPGENIVIDGRSPEEIAYISRCSSKAAILSAKLR